MTDNRTSALALKRAEQEASRGGTRETGINFVGLRHLVLALLDEDAGMLTMFLTDTMSTGARFAVRWIGRGSA